MNVDSKSKRISDLACLAKKVPSLGVSVRNKLIDIFQL